MINIEKFVKRRKELKLSQTELSDGICTQATLSKFENLGQIPSMRILTALCERLGLELSDLMNDDDCDQTIQEAFADANMAIISDNYEQLNDILQTIDEGKLKHREHNHYLFLKGRNAVEFHHNFIDGFYYYNLVLTDPEISHEDLLYLLALNGFGQIYQEQGDNERAEEYFNRVFDAMMIQNMSFEDHSIPILAILLSGGKFYASIEDYRTSTSLLTTAYQLCQEHNVVYYLSRILYQLALNVYHTENNLEVIDQYLNDATAFARLNKNFDILQKITNFPN